MITLASLVGTVRQAATLLLAPPPPNRRGGSYAVTVITPIYPERVESLREVLRGFNPGEGSPLHKVPDVQFARWVVIEQLRTEWRGAPRRASRLESPYLLFSADLTAPADRADGLPDTFFRDLAKLIPAECTEVWGSCRGFPGIEPIDDFVEYLRRSQIDMGLYFAGFPDATPDEITRALEFREKLAQFVVEHQHALSPARGSAGVQKARRHKQLQNDYIREFKRWGN